MQLTEPDEEITADDLKSLALDRLAELPMEGVEGGALDADPIMKVVLRAAIGQTSVWHVCSQTEHTPTDDTVRDWLRPSSQSHSKTLSTTNSRLTPRRFSTLNGRESSASTFSITLTTALTTHARLNSVRWLSAMAP